MNKEDYIDIIDKIIELEAPYVISKGFEWFNKHFFKLLHYAPQIYEKEGLSDLYYILGDVYDLIGAYKKAIRAYKKSIKLDKNHGESYRELVNVLAVVGKYKKEQ